MHKRLETSTEVNDRIAVSIERAADILDLGRSSIYELLRAGKLRSFRVGRAHRVTTQSIRQLVADAERQAG